MATHGFPRAYWIYLAGSCLVAAGFADYPLLAFHFHQAASVPAGWIPALYGLAMAVDTLAALVGPRDRRSHSRARPSAHARWAIDANQAPRT